MAWTVDIDGTDITPYCQQIRWRPRLSRYASCVVRYPSSLFVATTGVNEMHLYHDATLLFSGPVWYQQNDGDPDAAYTELTAYDHLIYLSKRMAKTSASYPDYDPPDEPGPCNLADPVKMILDYVTAPEIVAAFIQATMDCDPPEPPPSVLPLTVTSVATGGVDVTGLPADWPMEIDRVIDLLLSTGQLDVILTPGIGSSGVALTNGGYGNDLTGSVLLQYATGGFTAQRAGRTQDLEEMINALWYLLGPKRPQYDQDVSHWAGSITRTAPHVGGTWPPALLSRLASSITTYGYMTEIQVHDTREDENDVRPLYEERWANEAHIRAVPRTFANFSPNRSSTAGPPFFPGDLVTVAAGSVLNGGFTAAERVYEYEMTIDPDGIAEYSDLVTSADQE